MIELVNGNALKIPLADESVHMVVTSCPYFGLRDYSADGQLGLEPLHDCLGWAMGANCGECFICVLRLWCAEVWRVLRGDGTFWLNIGDSYANPGNKKSGEGEKRNLKTELFHGGTAHLNQRRITANTPGLKPKDLCLIPARVALALQADGWFVRSDIIWYKPNPMPESVTDRPSKAHEYLFLLTKQKKYYYDADAVREERIDNTGRGVRYDGTQQFNFKPKDDREVRPSERFSSYEAVGRNRRTVWEIATAPYPGAHFATFPPALVEPCIKAGTSERGCCPVCGKGWVRVVEKGDWVLASNQNPNRKPVNIRTSGRLSNTNAIDPQSTSIGGWGLGKYEITTLGWRPDCPHYPRFDKWLEYPNQGDMSNEEYERICEPIREIRHELMILWEPMESVPALVFDPFAGSGTTLLVARQLGRSAVGLDLSFDYLSQQARSRLSLDIWDEWGQARKVKANLDGLPLFAGEL